MSRRSFISQGLQYSTSPFNTSYDCRPKPKPKRRPLPFEMTNTNTNTDTEQHNPSSKPSRQLESQPRSHSPSRYTIHPFCQNLIDNCQICDEREPETGLEWCRKCFRPTHILCLAALRYRLGLSDYCETCFVPERRSADEKEKVERKVEPGVNQRDGQESEKQDASLENEKQKQDQGEFNGRG